MKKKHKSYLKLNFVSLLFIIISLISVTLAWFAYSGLAKVDTEIPVKAWYIEFKKDNEVVSNNVVIDLDEIYPGMDSVDEDIDIQNLGDSDAQLSYFIASASILNEDSFTSNESVSSDTIEDALSHDYPFHININLSKNYANSKGGASRFKVSVSWPLDSGDNALDSAWGNKAYLFQKTEQEKKNENSNYNIKSSIRIVIKVSAQQYIKDDSLADTNYNLGDEILYDVSKDKICTSESSSCIKTNVIDTNNKIGDKKVTLLPSLLLNYPTGNYANYYSLLESYTSSWNVENRGLTASDLLKVISTDINDSKLIRSDVSPSIIGTLKTDNRVNTELNRAISSSGYYSFITTNFNYLSSSSCYYLNTSYGSNSAFAAINSVNNNSKLYAEANTSSCKIVPVIIVDKDNLVK